MRWPTITPEAFMPAASEAVIVPRREVEVAHGVFQRAAVSAAVVVVFTQPGDRIRQR